MKVTIKYEVEARVDAEEVIISCQSMEEAERKLKSFHRNETEAYIIKTVQNGKSAPQKFFIM